MKTAVIFAILSALCAEALAEGSGGRVLSRGLPNIDAVKAYLQDSDRMKGKFEQCLADTRDPASSGDCWAAATATDFAGLQDQAKDLVLDSEKFMGAAADCKAMTDKESEENPKCAALRLADIFNLSHPDRETILKERNQGSMGRIVGLKLLLQQQQFRVMMKVQSQYGSLDAVPAAEKPGIGKEVARAGQPGNAAFQALIDTSSR